MASIKYCSLLLAWLKMQLPTQVPAGSMLLAAWCWAGLSIFVGNCCPMQADAVAMLVVALDDSTDQPDQSSTGRAGAASAGCGPWAMM